MTVRRFLIFSLILGVGILVLLGYAELVKARSSVPWLSDFAKFHLSAQALSQGQDIYQPIPLDRLGPLPVDANPTPQELHPNLNMPFVTIVFSPFVFTDISNGMAIWTALSVAFVLVSAWLMGSEIAAVNALPSAFRWMLSGAIANLLLIYYPSWTNAALGQLGHLLLIVLCGAWLAARRGRDRLAGILFGVALALKPFTGVFLLILPWLCRWRLLQWYIACFLALTLVSAAVAGPTSFLRYLAVLQEVDWYGFGWNASLLAPLSILLGADANSEWLHYPWMATFLFAICSIMLYVALLHQIRKLADPTTRLDLAVAGGMPLMLLASPLGWIYYFPLIWITAAAILMAVKPLKSQVIWWLTAIAMLVLCGLPFPFVNSKDAGQSLGSLLGTSLDTAALLIAYAVVVGAAWRLNLRENEDASPTISSAGSRRYTRLIPQAKRSC